MPRMWPRMAYEAPHGYVVFVERHLESLRRDAASVVGDEGEADLLYPDVLTDVAARWSWLELARRLLGRAGAADSYLDRAFARRSLRWRAEQWRSEQPGSNEIDVWRPDIEVWPSDHEMYRPPKPPPAHASAALRLAPHLAPERRPATAAAVAEAAVAWWHAYEAWRRRQVITLFSAVFVILVIVGHIQPNALSGG